MKSFLCLTIHDKSYPKSWENLRDCTKVKNSQKGKFIGEGPRFRTEDFFLLFLLCRRVIAEPYGNTNIPKQYTEILGWDLRINFKSKGLELNWPRAFYSLKSTLLHILIWSSKQPFKNSFCYHACFIDSETEVTEKLIYPFLSSAVTWIMYLRWTLSAIPWCFSLRWFLEYSQIGKGGKRSLRKEKVVSQT